MAKKKRIVLILALIAILAVAGWILAKTVIIPKAEDRRVQALVDSGDYEAAFALREEQRGKEAADALKREVADLLIEEDEYDAAYALLEELGDEDAVTADKRRRANDLIAQEDFDAAYALLEELGDEDAVTADKRRRANDLIAQEDFDAAYALLEELGDEDAVTADKQRRANDLIAQEDFDAAYAILEEIGDYDAISADRYRRAEELIAAEEYVEAAALLRELNSEDSAALLESIKEQYTEALVLLVSQAKCGDRLTFGSYEQDNDPDNGNEPLEWIVLANEGDRVQLLCAVCIDRQPYNVFSEDVTWETCTLRTWLNEKFLERAFTPEEQRYILTTTVPAAQGLRGEATNEVDTADKVYILSAAEIDEAEHRGVKVLDTIAPTTSYAAARGAVVYSNGSSAWWLRTPDIPHFVRTCSSDGTCFGSTPVSWLETAVRPVIWLDVSG